MLFDDFDSIFSGIYNSFNRPVKDMQPFKAYKNEKGYIIVCNTLGISKSDLHVKIDREKGNPYPILKIDGYTKIEKVNFENKVNLGITLRINDKIKSVNYEVKNGLTIVYLELEKPEVETLTAKYIDGELDW